MFRRSTSPPPSTTNTAAINESNKPLNDWKRRFQQKTKLKLGLTTDFKDNVTGNLEIRIERYRASLTKVILLKNECNEFCQKIRVFLSITTTSSFSSDVFVSKIYEEINLLHLNYVIEMMLVNDIEIPLNHLTHKNDEIEQLLKLRTDELLMDYQHHMRKLETLQEKSPHKTEDIKIRQGKVEASAERLKEGNQFLEANLKAFEFTYVRLKKRIANVIYAINLFISQTIASSLAAVSEVTPEISSILDQMHSIQISQEERRVMSVNASQDAAQIFHTYSGTTTSHHAQHHGSSSTINPTKSQPSSSGTKYKRSSSSLLRSSHESNWNDQAPASHNDSDCHGEEHFLPHCQADDDYSYALNLHMGVLGEVFGRSLTELQASSTDSHPVPDIVLDCLLFLLHNSLSIEGIFRISGDDDTIADLRRSYDEGKSHSHYRNATAASITESHDIASLIKYYLRLLPDPLFPKKSYRFLTETLQLPESEYLSQMKIFLSPHDGSETNPILPEKLCITNLKVLSYLFFVLHQITLHTEENKMTGDNLAIIFAPSLLCPEGSQELGLYELQNGIAIMKRLLEYCEEIFNPLWNEYPLEVVK